MLTIIDYHVGNLVSIRNMLLHIGYPDVRISSKPEDIASAKKLIIPGVGHFDYGMGQLRGASFFDILNERVLVNKVPVLGICLGAQLLLDGSEEGAAAGLGWIKGSSKRFDEPRLPAHLKIPHMGWGDVIKLRESKLIEDLPDDARFYFVHSFHMECMNPDHHLLQSSHGYPFIAAVEQENIVGVQFHPEKSHKYGMTILKNFLSKY